MGTRVNAWGSRAQPRTHGVNEWVCKIYLHVKTHMYEYA